MANGRNARRGGRPLGPQTFPKALIGMNVTSNVAEGLSRLEQAIKEKVIRPAARAGALVFYNEMRIRVPVDEGTLFGAIYHWHDDKRSTQGRQIYVVGPNKVKAPHWYVVEYGHWRVNVLARGEDGRWYPTKERLPAPVWVPAKPYARPSYDAKSQAAVKAMQARMQVRFNEIKSEITQ